MFGYVMRYSEHGLFIPVWGCVELGRRWDFALELVGVVYYLVIQELGQSVFKFLTGCFLGHIIGALAALGFTDDTFNDGNHVAESWTVLLIKILSPPPFVFLIRRLLTTFAKVILRRISHDLHRG